MLSQLYIMDNQGINKKRLFIASSLGLVVTAPTFAIRANLLETLGAAFSLSPSEVGEVAAAAFWGFTIAMFVGGPLCDKIGLAAIYRCAFWSHLLGILATIMAQGYYSLFFSTLLVGFANGFIESASYTLVSSLYPMDKARRINDWHIWFPAGIVIGGLMAYFLSAWGLGWQVQMAVMIPPTLVYGYLFNKQHFPKSERVSLGISDGEMVRECLRPLFVIMVCLMLLTSATELGTNQWIAALLANVGIPAILLLVFINGLMTVGRMYASTVLKWLPTTGLLFFSALFSCAGLLWLGSAQGWWAFVAAGVFAVGICYFWPTMIGFVSENMPRTGPLGLSIMGGAGLMSTAIVLPLFGKLYESRLQEAQSQAPHAAEPRTWQLIAGADTLQTVSVLPAILIVAFGLLHIYNKKNKKKKHG
ncbi:MFS transporter [Parapedobacter koreensis]|uniref:Fucose permease n=1 Tax=Parapedobacter koreensis TaxID=332977 RepID=A0A1H7QM47_9SPHI|nr:MFS transporter [Parapedobacter koreensis]SEL49003.1 Fucose permease [Parapedobacter koreensis]